VIRKKISIATSLVLVLMGAVQPSLANEILSPHKDSQETFISRQSIPDSKRAIQIALSGETGCALFANGKVRCWGNNDRGQAGTGLKADGSPKGWTHKPSIVKGVKKATYIAMGGNMACAIVAKGKVRCWGSNQNGRFLSASQKYYEAEPKRIPGIKGALSISLDSVRACVRTSSTVQCWGSVSSEPTGIFTPAGLENSVAIQVSKHGVTNSGGIFGLSESGEILYYGFNPRRGDQPRAVEGISNATTLSVNSQAFCYIDRSNIGYCKGPYNDSGRLGNGTTQATKLPEPVKGLPASKSIVIGQTSACAITTKSELYCWGAKGVNGFKGQQARAKKFKALKGVRAVEHSDDRAWSCAVTLDGRVFCWGGNLKQGNLGFPVQDREYWVYKPTQVKF
jgi:alpha-tubulin suppressor-like RCC1 family protein